MPNRSPVAALGEANLAYRCNIVLRRKKEKTKTVDVVFTASFAPLILICSSETKLAAYFLS
jgi:hypothetical protein